MDESNGNDLLSILASKTASNAAGNITTPTLKSNDDSSQSLSEYTDADESISAPTEFLAEVKEIRMFLFYNIFDFFFQFLSALMEKDYKKAFKYCKLSRYC